MAVDGRVPEGEDAPLLDLLDALVDGRGRVAAAEALGVNYRTVARCQQSRRVSRRMRQVLQEFRDAQDVGDDGPGVGVGDDTEEDVAESPEDRAAALEQENQTLRERVEAQVAELKALRRRVAEMEERGRSPSGANTDDGGQGQSGDWRPPRRRPEMPDPGVVTLEEQPDEEHAFGPAASLVAEWRELRTRDKAGLGRVDKAVAAVRRWELEAEMLGEFHLTLPPETAPLDDERRRDHVLWRRDALAEGRRELRQARWARWLRRAMTLGLWRE